MEKGEGAGRTEGPGAAEGGVGAGFGLPKSFFAGQAPGRAVPLRRAAAALCCHQAALRGREGDTELALPQN